MAEHPARARPAAPAAPIAAGCALLVTAITREVGGGRRAQTLAVWGSAFGTFTLVLGHSFLTATIDLLV